MGEDSKTNQSPNDCFCLFPPEQTDELLMNISSFAF